MEQAVVTVNPVQRRQQEDAAIRERKCWECCIIIRETITIMTICSILIAGIILTVILCYYMITANRD
jgi:hypothetical protein